MCVQLLSKSKMVNGYLLHVHKNARTRENLKTDNLKFLVVRYHIVAHKLLCHDSKVFSL